MRQVRVDKIEHILFQEWFFEYAVNAKLGSTCDDFGRRRGRDQQNRNSDAIGAEPFNQFQPGHVRHVVIQDHAGEVAYLRSQKLRSRCKGLDWIPNHIQQKPERIEDGMIVINNG